MRKFWHFLFSHFKKCQSKAMYPLYETMKVQIVFCCVAILCCCWSGKATISNGCKFAFSVLLTISFKCLTTITRSTWVLLFCLDEKAQNVYKVHSFSNRAIESKYFIRERGLIRFLTVPILKKNIWNIYGDFQSKFIPISKIHTD